MAYKVVRFRLRDRHITKQERNRLKELAHHSKNLYNQTNFYLKKCFENNEFPRKFDVTPVLRQTNNLEGEVNYYKLKSQVAMMTVTKCYDNWRSFLQSLKRYRKDTSGYSGPPKPPKFLKQPYFQLQYYYQSFQRINEEYIKLEKDVHIRIPESLKDVNIQQIHIDTDEYEIFANFIYIDNSSYEQIIGEKTMGIDLGLDNFATCVINDFSKPFVIKGSHIKSVNSYYNKCVKRLQSESMRKNGLYTTRIIRNITTRRNQRVSDFLHKSSRYILDVCLERGISHIYIGDVHTSLSGINLGKRNNRQFVTISHGEFINKLNYKCALHGITVHQVDESYTSKSSFLDDDPLPNYKGEKEIRPIFSGKRVKRGLFMSKEGYLINADVNGAANILRKVSPKFNASALSEGVKGWSHPTIVSIHR